MNNPVNDVFSVFADLAGSSFLYWFTCWLGAAAGFYLTALFHLPFLAQTLDFIAGGLFYYLSIPIFLWFAVIAAESPLTRLKLFTAGAVLTFLLGVTLGTWSC